MANTFQPTYSPRTTTRYTRSASALIRPHLCCRTSTIARQGTRQHTRPTLRAHDRLTNILSSCLNSGVLLYGSHFPYSAGPPNETTVSKLGSGSEASTRSEWTCKYACATRKSACWSTLFRPKYSPPDTATKGRNGCDALHVDVGYCHTLSCVRVYTQAQIADFRPQNGRGRY